MDKTVLTINGQDYYWQGAVLYIKSTTKSAWEEIKTFDSDIISVEPSNNGKMIVNTAKEKLLVELNGVIKMVLSRHKIVDI